MFEQQVALSGDELVTVRVVPSARMRRMRLHVSEAGRVEVKVPSVYAWSSVLQFVMREREWLRKVFMQVARRTRRAANAILLKGSRADYVANRARAEAVVRAHLADMPSTATQRLVSVRIGNQKTRWGSCSRRGTLSFNYRIVHLPETLQRYLVAHEVAHLTHMNHSKLFWKGVERLHPTYAIDRAALRRYIIKPS